MTTIFRAHRAIHGSPDSLIDGPATVIVDDDGIITAVVSDVDVSVSDVLGTPEDSAEIIELSDDQVLLPGLVDTHVHTNEPGRTEWEGFHSVTRAAAAGGVTTFIDMPLNSIPSTVTMDALAVKQEAAKEKVVVSVGFWGGAVPQNLGTGDLRQMWETGRVFGFKCFLLDSGVEEFAPLSAAQLDQAMVEIAEFDGLLIVHAEDPREIEEAGRAQDEAGGITDDYATFEASRPPSAEATAIATVIDTAERTGCRVHILHLSDAGSVDQITEAASRGVRITAETCPHYLSQLSEQIPDGATQFKCCPPIRTAANREGLWRALRDGVISTIGSDHSPCTADLKRLDTGSFGDAWGGIASVQISLPVVWSQARLRGAELTDVVRWMSSNPAALVGLDDRGAIAPGRRADLVAFSPDDAFLVLAEQLHHRNKITAYNEQALSGVVHGTWIRGERIYSRPGTQLSTDPTPDAFTGTPQEFTLRP